MTMAALKAPARGREGTERPPMRPMRPAHLDPALSDRLGERLGLAIWYVSRPVQ